MKQGWWTLLLCAALQQRNTGKFQRRGLYLSPLSLHINMLRDLKKDTGHCSPQVLRADAPSRVGGLLASSLQCWVTQSPVTATETLAPVALLQ